MGDSSSKPHTEQPMSPIHTFPIEDMYTPEFSDSFQHTDSFQETAREDSHVEVVDPLPKSKLTRVRQKRTYQNEDAPQLQESGTKDEDYYNRALLDYEAKTRVPFKLCHCWEVL
ncbi:hypothetical protein Tco_0586778 [Tanacetum coccineum]